MSKSLITPSAKSHERISGRWTGNGATHSARERLVNYFKQVVGTPIPYLMWAYAGLVFFTRAGVEIAAWGTAILAFFYIAADRFVRVREFSFFRVGADFCLLGFVVVGVISALSTTDPLEIFASLSGVRWVLLLYLMAYALELFPGLNRIFTVLLTGAAVASIYGIWQHFSGLDLVRGVELSAGPVPALVYFTSTGFFGTPELFGTLLAMTIPFPAAAYLLLEGRGKKARGLAAFLFLALLTTALFCTYRTGLWMAASMSLIVLGLMSVKRFLSLAIMIALLGGALAISAYGDPGQMWASVEKADEARSTQQRAQINTQVKLWEESPWVGVGHRATDAAGYDPGTGNVYFQIVAQTGVFGALFYLLFLLGFLLLTYRVFYEIPRTHYWHRVFISGAVGSQIAFHVAGLYWSTLTEAVVVNLFILILAAVGYLVEHYNRGLVPDDRAL